MQQALTEWSGDVPSLITEMKRRAGVPTDQALAQFMNVAQSTVAGWRKRDTVPDSAILKFEERLNDPRHGELSRLMAARMIALRLPELWYQRFAERGSKIDRHLVYMGIAINLGGITSAIAEQMERLEAERGLDTNELSALLFNDDNYLQEVVEWIEETSLADLFQRTLNYADHVQRL